MISIVVPTVDIGMLNATLPGWIANATGTGEVVVINGSQEPSKQVYENLKWMKKTWMVTVAVEKYDTVMAAMFQGYEIAMSDIVVFLHDDVFIHEKGWDLRIENELLSGYPKTGVVGLGGCTELQADTQTAGQYISNWDDAEFYGTRCKDSRVVAHVDGQCLAIRRQFLENSPWQLMQQNVGYFAVYDAWFSCIAREKGLAVRMIGISSYHVSWLKGDGIRHHRSIIPETVIKTSSKIRHHQGQNLTLSREYLSSRYRNILPIKVEL